MRTLLTPIIIITLFVMVRSIDLALGGNRIFYTIAYMIVAILAVIAIVLTLFG